MQNEKPCVTIVKSKIFGICVNKILKNISYCLFLGFASTVTIVSELAYAASVPSSCNANYYSVLEAKGYLEGKRELERAQRIILKPDSVLEYSCFYQNFQLPGGIGFIGEWGATFSENGLLPEITVPEFNGNPLYISADSLDKALSNTVFQSLVEYLDNFDHIYGGGTFSAPVIGTTCNPMNIVWHASKCENFDKNFWVENALLAGYDIRTLPEPCTAFDPGRGTRIAAALAAAYPPPATLTILDPITNIYKNELDASSCSGVGNTPVKTGIVSDFNGTSIEDAICIKPGCYYTGTGGTCQ